MPLFRWRRSVVVPRGHPLTSLGREVRLADLDGQPLVSYESSLRPESSLHRAFAAGEHRAALHLHVARCGSDQDLCARRSRRRHLRRDGDACRRCARSASCSMRMRCFPNARHGSFCAAIACCARYAAALAELIAPQLDPRDLQRALVGELPASAGRIRRRGRSCDASATPKRAPPRVTSLRIYSDRSATRTRA